MKNPHMHSLLTKQFFITGIAFVCCLLLGVGCASSPNSAQDKQTLDAQSAKAAPDMAGYGQVLADFLGCSRVGDVKGMLMRTNPSTLKKYGESRLATIYAGYAIQRMNPTGDTAVVTNKDGTVGWSFDVSFPSAIRPDFMKQLATGSSEPKQVITKIILMNEQGVIGVRAIQDLF